MDHTSKSRGGIVVRLALAATFGATVCAVHAAPSPSLPPEAEAAVKKLFPAASVIGVGQEREQGVLFYEVVVRNGENRVEIEVAPDGAVGEVESAVSMADLPKAALDQVLRLSAGAPLGQIERHEVHGLPRDATFAPLDPPRVFFEVACRIDGVRREFQVGADGETLGLEEQEDTDDEAEEEEEDD